MESVGTVVLDELKKQARAEGYYVLALSRDDAWLIAACLMYFCLGVMWAAK